MTTLSTHRSIPHTMKEFPFSICSLIPVLKRVSSYGRGTAKQSKLAAGESCIKGFDIGTNIPFNCISKVGTEAKYIEQAYDAMHLCGDGQFTIKCQGVLEQELGVGKVLLTTSGTHALEIAALLLDLKPGDEVIVPAFTFPSVANAFVLRGARPVFADIRADTMNLDETLLPELISDATRVIVPVHYAGVGCEMDRIGQLAARHGISLVEDNAHGLFGRYRGKPLGSFGCLSAQSFHETKNFSCGEGGALVINDLNLLERAEIIREKGTDRKKFFRGQVDKYTWVDTGSSYLPSDILAAVLYAQFEVRNAIQAARKKVWLTYQEGLAEWAGKLRGSDALRAAALRANVPYFLSCDAGYGSA